MDGGVLDYPTAAGSSGGKNGREKLLLGVWYMFYSKLSVQQTGPQAGRSVLQFHLAIDLLLHGLVRQVV